MELLDTYQINNGTYMYSCMDELVDGSIGLMWEHSAGGIRYDNFSINTIISNGEIGQDIELTIPLYTDISSCVLGAATSDDLQGLDENIVNVTNIKGEIFTLKGIKTGDTSFTVNDVKYTIHVTEPAPEDISEIEIAVGENYEIDVLSDAYEQYGDSICANDDVKLSFKGAKAGITDIVINGHVYRFTVVDRIYTVTLNANGGNVDQDSFDIKFGELYDKLPTPVYQGHVFDGWYDENGKLIDRKSRHEVLENVTLTARWKKTQSTPQTPNRPSDKPKPDISENPSNKPKPDTTEKPSDKPHSDTTEKPSDKPEAGTSSKPDINKPAETHIHKYTSKVTRATLKREGKIIPSKVGIRKRRAVRKSLPKQR